MPLSIAIADHHAPDAEKLANQIRKLNDYQVVIVAKNGRELLNQLRQKPLPDIVLAEMNLPDMDVVKMKRQLQKQYPSVRVIAMAGLDGQENRERAMRSGVRGYLCKEHGMADLEQSLNKLMVKESRFASDQDCLSCWQTASYLPVSPASLFALNNREYRFLRMACSELTYNEIADQMCVSPRTVDGYREMVFQKMSVRSRVGMVIKAVRHKLIEL